jgi:sec-independent protein translocase protein TatA
MGGLSVWHWIVVLAVVMLLFGYRKLPDAARSLGRSMRIFKSEVKQMKDDDEPAAPLKEPRPIEGTVTRDDRPITEPRQSVPDPDRRDS